MKCPSCGNDTHQQQLSHDVRGEIAYRCAACGRLYALPLLGKEIAEIQNRLAELKAKTEALVLEQQKLQEHIAERQAQLEDAARSAERAKGHRG